MEGRARSSSNDLSSAPNSDIEGSTPNHTMSNTITVARDAFSNHLASGVSSTKRNESAAVAVAGERQDTAPKQRKPRKKKDSDLTATPTEKKEKGTRRPRGSSAAATGSTRKKVKTETPTPTPAPVLQNLAPTTQAAYPRPAQTNTIDPAPQPNSGIHEAAKSTQNGFSNNSPPIITHTSNVPQYNPTPPPPPPPIAHVVRSMAYDPVRSLTMPRNTESHVNSSLPHSHFSTPPRPTYNPSTSPAISGIINPPEIERVEAKVIPPSHHLPTDANSRTQPNITTNHSTEIVTSMEIDPQTVKNEPLKKDTPEAAAPKPATKPRAKEQPPPLPTGSGLLSSSLFGGDSGMDAKSATDKGTSIVLHIDLRSPNNKVINFARMAEEKYGFAALYPRQAAQKERLAKVAAAGAALERAGSGTKGTPAGESGDEDVSVDIDRDSDNDGDVAMSGVNGTGEAVNSGTDGPVPKRRKRKDEYDADDPFVDDSELLWEAQAAASKDGFFVYCGPLVPEGEKPSVERADGTIKRGRGRGRGGGPGSRGGRGAAAAARDAEGGSTRGGGPGSRGGGTTRKPRITKAERAQRELEKKQREQMAVLAAKPPNYQP